MKRKFEEYLLIFATLNIFLASVNAGISISNNGYQGIVVAIADDVTEDEQLVARIQDVFTAASQLLYTATRCVK